VKKKFNLKKIIIVIAIILFFYFLIFSFWQPLDNEITQNRPIIKFLCKMQPANCKISVSPSYPCSGIEDSYWMNRLNRWGGFHGCNNQTQGYREDGYVTVETCSCMPWFYQ